MVVRMRFVKQLTLALILLVVSASASAKTALEAESYLGRAQTFYNLQDYRNALMNAHIAKIIYQEIGDSSGASRASSLISEIDGQTTAPLRAGYYYAIGSDYFFSVDEKTDSYDKMMDAYTTAKYFARLSSQLYDEAGDKAGSIKASDLMQEAGKKIERLQGQEKAKADSYYSAARTSFLSKEYGTALIHAQMALEIYTNISDQESISNTNSLIGRINTEVSDIKKNGETTIRTAKKYYGEENYIESLKYAEKAKALFESINDELGALEAKDLISIINSRIQTGVEERKTTAASLYRQAQDDIVKMKCDDAIDKSKESRSIYEDIRREAKTEGERDLYNSLIHDCDVLIARIISECGIDDITARADTYYKEAQEFYLKGYYREALSYAEKAKSLNEDVENYVGIEKARSLIDEITDAMAEEKAFSDNMSLARLYAGKADFQNARIHVGYARKVASNLLYSSNKTDEVDELFASILAGEEKIENAKGYYDRAYNSFARAEYDTAENELKGAIDLYKSVNHSMGLNQSMLLYDRVREKQSEISSRTRTMVLSLVVVALVVFVIVVNYLKKRKDMQKERDIVVQKIESEKKEEERRWKIEEETETKKRVDEEFRRMIEAERKHELSAGVPPQEKPPHESVPYEPKTTSTPPKQPPAFSAKPAAPPAKPPEPPKKQDKPPADSSDSVEDEIKKIEEQLKKEAEKKKG